MKDREEVLWHEARCGPALPEVSDGWEVQISISYVVEAGGWRIASVQEGADR